MLNRLENPVEWALLLYELDDARQHLQTLIDQMSTAGQVDEVDYRIQVSHIYAHLNRAWNSRNTKGELTEGAYEASGVFPKDINPL